MNLCQFNFCSLDRRAEIVWKRGTYLAVRLDGVYSVVLYHMGEFFAEVWYDPEGNRLMLVSGFMSRRRLEPYLELVTLEELIG